MAEFAVEIKELGDKIAALKVSQAVELGNYLEEVHKIKPAAGAVVAAGPAAGAAGPAPAAAEQTEFSVVLESFGADKIKVIKVVREITGLGLKEAKDLVEGAPKAVKENVDEKTANEIKGLEKEVAAAGHQCGWEEKRPSAKRKVNKNMPLCHGCEKVALPT